MKIICELTTFVLVGLFFTQFSAVGATTDEDLQIKIDDPNLRVSHSQMCAMLKKANLESRGFKKEIIRKSVNKPGKDGSDNEIVYFYYKFVQCSDKAMQEIEQELNTSLPGAVGKEMSKKITKEVKDRHLESKNGQCKMGLEVDFKEEEGCDMEREKRNDDESNEVKTTRRGIKINGKVKIKINVKIRVKWSSRRRRRRRSRGWK